MEPKDQKITQAMSQLAALLRKQDSLVAAVKKNADDVSKQKAEITKLLATPPTQ
jgi:hypothetical protein